MHSFNPQNFEAALAAARHSFDHGGVPVGAALERGGRLLAVGHNQRVQAGDPTAHGEISCLRAAGRQASYKDTVLYTTLVPCAMCAGSIIQFGIPTVVVGEAASFPGELDLLRERGIQVVNLQDQRCMGLMQRFQQTRPALWAEDIGR
ncbi:nucleoside deaminase [Arthrobacter mobilis]|uniref:Nucleoside deaminase n=1 Tax=Arthrobacter mobilis TaxID=2724944 RepID=A0A7X6K838_9MICC|nr:nucleoside deaminase [Arthrobacter mobilis]NKX56892.1 nucleoside deaminase [Arthrobacter mobilis]